MNINRRININNAHVW